MKLLVKVLYIPFGIIFGLLGKRAGQQLFGVLYRGDSPSPCSGDGSLAQVVAAATIRPGAFAATAAAADRAGARTFRHLFGAWPDQPPTQE